MNERPVSHVANDDRALRDALETEQSLRRAAQAELDGLMKKTAALEAELVKLRERVGETDELRRLAFANEIWSAVNEQAGAAIGFAVLLFVLLAVDRANRGLDLAAWAFLGFGYVRLKVVANEHARRLAAAFDEKAAVKAELSGTMWLAQFISYGVAFSPFLVFFLFLKIKALFP